jgi:hypothetical protein
MRELTSDEAETLERRRAVLDQFVREGWEVLVDFVEALGLPEPGMVLRVADEYVAPVDRWLSEQVIGPEDRIWLLPRVGYFIGEVLIQRFSGSWFIDEDPDSPWFAHYVVGRFTSLDNPWVRIDPLAVASNLVDEPPGRSLLGAVERKDVEIRRLGAR